jgi:hypothetical protein
MKKTLVVGGTFNIKSGKTSKIISTLSRLLDADSINGGTIDELKEIDIKPYHLIIWMPNIIEDVEKSYPKKSVGSVLICSKVMREGYTSNDSISRIFKMRGNAVIEIHKEEKIRFKLVDALGNTWINTKDISTLVYSIKDLQEWTSSSVRVGTKSICSIPQSELEELCRLVRIVSDNVQNQVMNRYFGNASGRCVKTFPSCSTKNGALISTRNIDKRYIEPKDFIYTQKDNNNHTVCYVGNRKPSVDAPIQLRLYELFPKINYMIHGHAYITEAKTTESYFPCGDIREVKAVKKHIASNNGILNLKNHGFLIYAESLKELEKIILTLNYTKAYDDQINKNIK